MVIRAVHGRPHQVYAAGVQSHEFFMGVLDVQHLADQQVVGAGNETAHLGVDRHVCHAGRTEDPVVDFVDLCADDLDIVRRLVGPVCDAHAAGQVDEGNVHAGLVPQFYCQFEQLARQRRIVIVRNGVARQKRMDAAVLNALFLQQTHPFEHLLRRKAVFGFAGVVHDRRVDRKAAAGVIPHGNCFRQFADGFFAEIDVGNIVEIDDGTDLGGILELRCGGHVRRKHDLIPRQIHGLRKGKFRPRRTVAAEAIVLQNSHDRRIRTRFYREEFPVPRIPGKRPFDSLAVFPQPLLIVKMERRRVCLNDLFDLFFRNERSLFH